MQTDTPLPQLKQTWGTDRVGGLGVKSEFEWLSEEEVSGAMRWILSAC